MIITADGSRQQLSAINRYPVKSCRGQALDSALVEPWGLAGDRRWMLVDESGDLVTARELPRLVLVRPEPTGDGLLLRAPDRETLRVHAPDGSEHTEVRIWNSTVAAAPASEQASAWFSNLLETPVRLVYLDDPTRRATNPAHSRPEDRVSFADGYPMLLATEESLAALNDLISGGPLADQGPLPMTRFRPNLVVSGAPAWAEDGWRLLRIGSATFRVAKASDRCVFTTIDPDTAVKGKEPIATLARYRKWDGKTWFGLNLIPDTPGARLRVGDDFEILEQVDTSEPLR